MIAIGGGRWLAFELKSKRGRLTPAQKAMKLNFSRLGHIYPVVKSFRAFLKLYEERRNR